LGTSGAASGRSWWAINAAILLVIPFVLNSCVTGAVAAPADKGDILVTVTGADGRRLIHGVIVRVTNSSQSDSEDNDAFKVESCTIGQFIAAWAPGYQVSFVPCDGIKNEYPIQLQSLETIDDNPDYLWRSADADCSKCHAGQFGLGYDEFKEWKVSGHATTSERNRYFESLYPAQAENCAACHAPAALLRDEKTAIMPLSSSGGGGFGEGITCDVCHKVNAINLENNLYPFVDRPGIRSFQLVRSDSFQLGPFSNIIVPYPELIGNSRSMCSRIFGMSEFCAACHYGMLENTLVYTSYKEWKESRYGSDPTSNEYRTCQDCHMAYMQPNGGNRFSYQYTCSETDAGFQDFSHNLMNYGYDATLQKNIPRMIRGAVEMRADFEYRPQENNKFLVHVTIQNSRVGHNFPTDTPLRHLILAVEVKDQFSKALFRVDGTQIPVLGGLNTAGIEIPGVKAYAGMPGKIFMNPLVPQGASLPTSVAYWNQYQPQSGLINDAAGAIATLGSGAIDVSTYAFAAPIDGEVKITVSLLYRFGFYDLIQQKNWVDSATQDRADIPVVVLECFGNTQTGNFRCDRIQ